MVGKGIHIVMRRKRFRRITTLSGNSVRWLQMIVVPATDLNIVATKCQKAVEDCGDVGCCISKYPAKMRNSLPSAVSTRM